MVERQTSSSAQVAGLSSASLLIFPSLPTPPFQINLVRMPQPARGLNLVLEIAMPVSDILLECSKECARLSRDCQDDKIALTLFEISTRLLAAAARDAELVTEDACTTPQSDLSFGFVDED